MDVHSVVPVTLHGTVTLKRSKWGKLKQKHSLPSLDTLSHFETPLFSLRDSELTCISFCSPTVPHGPSPSPPQQVVSNWWDPTPTPWFSPQMWTLLYLHSLHSLRWPCLHTDSRHATYRTPLPARPVDILKLSVLDKTELLIFSLRYAFPIVFLFSENGCSIFACTWAKNLGHTVDVSLLILSSSLSSLLANRSRWHLLPPSPPASWSISTPSLL